MKSWRKNLCKFAIMFFSLFMFIGVLDTQPVHASTKASYTIKTIQEKKTYKKSSAAYLFQLPQLKGSSTAVKKINKSLKSEYQKSLTDKKRLFEYFNDFKRNGALDKNNWKLFSTTHCKETYNKNGYIRFVFTSSWYAGGVHNSDTQTVIYRLKDGVKTNKLPSVSEETKALNLIKGTWYTEGGLPYHFKVVFSGKTVKDYLPNSSKVYSQRTIDKVIKTNYGYYFRIYLGKGYYGGYRLDLKNKNTLVCIGNGDPYSSSGYSATDSLVRKK